MVQIYGRFSKQPNEVLDYDVDMTDWFSNRADSIASFTVSVPTGITEVGSNRNGNVIKIILSGGSIGEKYKVTVLVTTSTGVVKEVDFIVSIKEV